MTVGENVRNIRKNKGLTIMDVRKITGLSKSTISELENDKSSPTTETLQKIATALGVSIEEFFKTEPATKEKLKEWDDEYNPNGELAKQLKFIESLQLNSPEEALKFILQQPAFMAYGGYDLKKMSEEEIMDLANDMLLAMKLSIEKKKNR